jgi:tricorn protease
MIINESAGSGGDYLPYMFKKAGIGPLVGTRTWGGLVGIWDTPPFIDGGFITAPRGGFFNTEGVWEVENEGVAPDVEVEQWPKEVAAGHDPQLERAVAEAMRLLAGWTDPRIPEPAPPVRVKSPTR